MHCNRRTYPRCTDWTLDVTTSARRPRQDAPWRQDRPLLVESLSGGADDVCTIFITCRRRKPRLTRLWNVSAGVHRERHKCAKRGNAWKKRSVCDSGIPG